MRNKTQVVDCVLQLFRLFTIAVVGNKLQLQCFKPIFLLTYLYQVYCYQWCMGESILYQGKHVEQNISIGLISNAIIFDILLPHNIAVVHNNLQLEYL